MKGGILCCMLLLDVFKAFAQAPPTDTLITGLINSIYLERVNPAAKFYYLDEKGENLGLDKYDIDHYTFIEDKELLKNVPIDELIAATKLDTTSINWSRYHLIKARCVLKPPVRYSYSVKMTKVMPFNTPDSTMQGLRNKSIIAFRVKQPLSDRQFNKATEKAIERYEKETPIEDKNFYSFSKPAFSKNRQYALIALNGSGSGCLYIFKLTDGHWVKVYKFRCWVV